MADNKKESSSGNLFSTSFEVEPGVLSVRLGRNRFTSDEEMNRLKASLDNVVAKQRPHVIAFDLGNFDWFSEEVIELLLRYQRNAERTELRNSPQYFVEKLSNLHLAHLFTISPSGAD